MYRMSGGLVPLKTNAGPSATLFGAGGGGQSTIGPNPAVSSLTFAPYTGGTTTGVLNISSELVIQDFGTAVGQDFKFRTGFPTSQLDYLSSFASTINFVSVNGDGGDGNNGTLILAGSSDGRTLIHGQVATNNITSTLTILGDPVVIPYDLQVSSINGATPGTSTGIPAAGISTNQVANASGNILTLASDAATTITIDSSKGAINLIANSGTGDITFTAYSTIVTNDLSVSSINGQAPGTGSALSSFNQLFTSSIGVPNPIADDLIIVGQNSYVNFDMTSGVLSQIGFALSTSVAALFPSVVNISAYDLGNNDYILSVGRPGGSANVITSISSLNVSSINGQTPGGGGALQFSTLGIPGGSGISSFVLTAGTTNTLVEFSTIAGHVYQASVVARASSGPVADSDSILSEIVDSVAGNEIIGSWPLSQISTLSGSSFLQQIGGSITWKAGGTGAFFSLYPTAVASARIDGINLIDFGAI